MDEHSELRGFLRSRWGLGVIVFLGTAAVLLVFDHWTHIVESKLFLGGLLFVCAAMHLFMHGGHGGHGGHGDHGGRGGSGRGEN